MQNFIELEEAQLLLTEGLHFLGVETLPLHAALRRTLAENISAPLDQPPFDRSPLDGYAFRAIDSDGASPGRPVKLSVTETLYAGDVPSGSVGVGQAARIMTGAMLPQGVDCVLRQEDTDMGALVVSIFREMRPDENVIHRGEDYQAGTLLLPAGTRLDAAALGLLSSAGIFAVSVQRRPVVALLTTGDEIVSPDTHPLPPGKVYSSNLALLTARLAELGIPVAASKQTGDDPQIVAETIRELLEGCDVLITTGGVSVGDRDIFHQALPLMHAEQVFWRIRSKPGTPAMFSRYRGKPIVSLSGNPFAAAVTFELLARPVLAALSGEPELLPVRKQGLLKTSFSKASPGRRFIRGRYQDGCITLPHGHASGMLASLIGCNCLVDIPAGSGPLAAGQRVEILLL